MAAPPFFCVPGQRIPDPLDAQSWTAGDGVIYQPHTHSFHATVTGVLHRNEESRTVSVHTVSTSTLSATTPFRVPQVQDVVTAKVTRITPVAAHVDILLVDRSPVRHAFKGLIRKQDIRSFDRDAVLVHRSFRPLDIVRAVVLSLGDAQSYYLTTARDDLGVVLAISRLAAAHSLAAQTTGSDVMMVPVSWEQMQCPLTKNLEYRKCAKPSAIRQPSLELHSAE